MLALSDTRLRLPEGGARARMQAIRAVTPMRKSPDIEATQISQLLLGETVIAQDREGAFIRVQNESDAYIGWVQSDALSASVLDPTHRISCVRSHAYSAPKVTAAPTSALSLGMRLTATGTQDGAYLEFERVGWMAAHLVSPLNELECDPASVAEGFIGTPYLWGGRTSQGLDCSGLVQIAFEACGVSCPRDSDMQANWFGNPISDWDQPGALRRGDLVFWKGHVGIMLDAATVLHANGTFMTTMQEPLAPAIERIAKEYGEPLGARRVELSRNVAETPAWLTAEA